MWDLHGPGIKLETPALQGGFLTTGLPGKPLLSTSGYIATRMESRILKRYLHTHFHSSFIHHSREVEAAQMSIRWMNGYKMSYVHILPLLSRFSSVRLCVTPWTAAYQASLSMGFSRQEHWSGLPFPSPMHESGK